MRERGEVASENDASFVGLFEVMDEDLSESDVDFSPFFLG